MNVRHLVPLLAGLLLPCAVDAANHTVTIIGNSFSPSELTVAQGDTVTFRNSSGGLHNAASDDDAPNLFRCATSCSGFGGNPSASAWQSTVTMSNPGLTRYYCEIHGGPGGDGMSGSITVTAAPASMPAAVDDLVRLRINGGAVDIDVLANDFTDADGLAGGTLSIVAAPGAGTATVIAGGDGTTVADDRIRYSPPADAAADTTLRYRVCHDGTQCSDGDVRVLVRAFVDADLMHTVPGDGGFVDVPLASLPALVSPVFETTAMAEMDVSGQHATTVDATPRDPWDGGGGAEFRYHAIPVPADGLPQEWGVFADFLYGTDADLYVGVDLDGDQAPDENEVRCTSAMSSGTERCETRFVRPGSGAAGVWAMTHNRGAAQAGLQLGIFATPLVPGDARLVMTGPGHLPADAASVARLGWDDPDFFWLSTMGAFARVRDGATDFGWVPVRLERDQAGDRIGRALVSGRDYAFRIWSEAVDRLYIDVPPNATSLTVTLTADTDVDLYLAQPATFSGPGIDPAPPRDQAVASDTGPATTKTITLVPPQLEPGRWYVTPVFEEFFAVATATLRATVAAADVPEVRSGSYFNPDRGGHGLFLYPAAAGAVWTVLWYHYFEDDSPTWYYLEGAAPAANGVFTSPIYRSAWDGDSNSLTPVGEATLTPTGPDSFRWSWTLDGRSASEVLYALGRECPTVDGVTRDISATWFDPATAGTGYSVQVFPNGYEYTAAFVYDGHGRPRYLAAERPPPPDGAVSTYALEQLTGFCPLCPRDAAPARQDIGTFTRTLDASGTLQRIEVDAIYASGIPGAWTGDDQLQPLGGPGTTQGCEP